MDRRIPGPRPPTANLGPPRRFVDTFDRMEESSSLGVITVENIAEFNVYIRLFSAASTIAFCSVKRKRLMKYSDLLLGSINLGASMHIIAILVFSEGVVSTNSDKFADEKRNGVFPFLKMANFSLLSLQICNRKSIN